MNDKDELTTESIKIIDTTTTAEVPVTKKKKNFFKEILSYIVLIGIAYGLAYLVHLYIFTPVSVIGDSMLETLHDDDYILIWRLGSYERTDIIVFEVPDDNNDYYIKRVIGTPGDDVYFLNNRLYVNGVHVEEPYLGTHNSYTTDFNLEQICNESNTNCNVNGEIRIPDGYYLVLGDNRTISRDSRHIGLIKKEYIIGKAVFVLYPFDRIKKLW